MNKHGQSQGSTHRTSFLSFLLCTVLMATSLAGCSQLAGAALSTVLSAGGGGPKANVQAGKTNTQSIGKTTVDSRKVEVKGNAPVVNQDTNTTNNNSTAPWLIFAFAIAVFLDSPLRWPGQVWRAFRGTKKS